MKDCFLKIKQAIDRIIDDPAKAYLIIALVGVVGFVFITPPFQGPDEEAHYNRVQYISHGHFIPRNVEGDVSLPSSIQDTLNLTFFENDIRGKTSSHYEFWRTKEAAKTPLDSSKRFHPIMLTYNFLTYLPAVPAVALANVFNLNAVVSLYLARLSLAIAAVAIVYFAIKLIPCKKCLFAVLALTPMLLFQQSMVGTDGVSYAIFMLFLAYLLKIYSQKNEISRNQWLKFIFICGLLMWSKPLLYIFLPISIILIKKKNFWKWIAVSAIVCITLLGVNQLMVMNQTRIGNKIGGQLGSPTNVDVSKQASMIAKNPKRFARVMWNSYMTHFGDDEVRGIVGTFGYADVYYPLWMNYGWVVIVVIAFIADTKHKIKVKKKWKVLAIILSLVHFVAVNLFTYLVYTPFNFEIVYGVQGRYFLPTAIHILVILSIGINAITFNAGQKTNYKRFIMSGAFAFMILALLITLQRYFLFTP